jgi:hypothetical protein
MQSSQADTTLRETLGRRLLCNDSSVYFEMVFGTSVATQPRAALIVSAMKAARCRDHQNITCPVWTLCRLSPHISIWPPCTTAALLPYAERPSPYRRKRDTT